MSDPGPDTEEGPAPFTRQLARCDLVLNNTSWTKLQEGCSHGAATPGPDAEAETKPAQPAAPKSTEPNEPNAN